MDLFCPVQSISKAISKAVTRSPGQDRFKEDEK
jgi:hypothetical protein